MDIIKFSYAPILSLQPAEMVALEELSKLDKDKLLPIVSLKGWVSSKCLDNSLKRLEKAFGNRSIIIDIDEEFLYSKWDKSDNSYPDKQIYKEFEELLDSKNGYENWVSFIVEKSNFIPVLQLEDLSELDKQVKSFKIKEVPIVVRVSLKENDTIDSKKLNGVVKCLLENDLKNLSIVIDCGDITRKNLLDWKSYADFIKRLGGLFPNANFIFSSTSFPYSFAGAYRGELPIYERQIFEKISGECSDYKLIYSDRGSARAGKLGGGGGSIPVRLDYPLKKDWRFIRIEVPEGADKTELYKQAAQEMIASDYWSLAVPVWGTQMIEKTSYGDPYAIISPIKATAVRINIHLFQQLYYNKLPEEVVTEEDWED